MEHRDDDEEAPAAAAAAAADEEPEPEPWDGVERRAEVRAGRWPVYARNASGHPAPDLGRLPRHRWRQALAETELSARMSAANSAGERFHEAFALLGRVPPPPLPESQRRAALVDVRAAEARAFPHRLPPAPAVSSAHRARASRQVNVRLSAAQHSELAAMAEAVGLRPTQLARQLIVRGVRAAAAP